MDSELVQNILKNRRENKLLSKEEITNEIQTAVYQVYRDVINYESNKLNLQNTLEKLENYKYCKKISDLRKGDYIRYLNSKYFYDIKLNLGGFIEDIQGNLINVLVNNKFYKIRYDKNEIFIRLKDEDLLKLEIIELLEKN
tara:strand:- start:222 stop:644 length:423 start_codon:yes stop_codon:yes gene_type:complete